MGRQVRKAKDTMSTSIRHHNDEDKPIPIIESSMEHTDLHPFCPVDPSCPCHKDPILLAPLAQAVQDGLMTPDEATDYAMGRTLQGGGWA